MCKRFLSTQWEKPTTINCKEGSKNQVDNLEKYFVGT